MGMFEEEEFSKRTKELLTSISKNKKAIKIAGGGDTIFAIEKYYKSFKTVKLSLAISISGKSRK